MTQHSQVYSQQYNTHKTCTHNRILKPTENFLSHEFAKGDAEEVDVNDDGEEVEEAEGDELARGPG